MTQPPYSEEDIFQIARRMEDGKERAAYLDRVCGEDVALREQIDLLLGAFEKTGSFLESPISEVLEIAENTIPMDLALAERPGEEIGPYRLREIIGEGGFGLVYVAEQEQPIRRKVALKVIKPGMDSRQVIARFEAERQALALMDHPHIAKVLDAGTTTSGRPYFVMELVHGVPITRFCDQQKSTVEDRLTLFIDALGAVQHAHQKGIIHRDLKPSNILVTMHDDRPVVKVIDFGVAKAINQRLTEHTVYTSFGQMIGTPMYMSPEQAQMNDLDIDTRSDIYSLGVLLYELLTGVPPFDADSIRHATFDQIRRLICESEPPRPSHRLQTLPNNLVSTVADQRQVDLRHLSKQIPGDLDWIVMKALEKDRNRRYESANSFALDVKRYLANEPVLACPPRLGYRLRKFLRRNRSPLAATGLVGLTFLGIIVAVLWAAFDHQARESQIAKEQLERSASLSAQVREILAEVERLEREEKWAEALVATHRAEAVIRTASLPIKETEQVQRVLKEMEYINRLESARLIHDAGEDSFNIAAMDRAYREVFHAMGVDLRKITVQEASQRLRAYHGITSAIAFALDDWARLGRLASLSDVHQLTELAQAIDDDPIRRQIRQAILEGRYDTLHALADSSKLAQYPAATLWLLGISHVNADQRARIFEYAQLRFPGDFWINLTLGLTLVNTHPPQWQKALPYLHAALAIRPNSKLRVSIGHALGQLGRLDEAETVLRKGIEVHPHHARTYWALAYVARRRGQWEKAIALNRKAIELDPQIAIAYVNLGANLRDLGRLDESVAAQCKAIEIQPNLVWAWLELGITRTSQGKTEEAIGCFRQVIRLDPKIVFPYRRLGSVLLDQDRFDEAEDCFRDAIKANLNEEEFYERLGALLVHQWKLDEAIACYRKAIEIKPKDLAMFQSKLSYCLNNLSWQLATHPDPKRRDADRAVVLANEAVALRASEAGYWNTLGVALYRKGDYPPAIKSLEKSCELNSGGIAIDFFFLAMARWQLGDKVAARQEFDKAVQWMKQHRPFPEEVQRFHEEAEELGIE